MIHSTATRWLIGALALIAVLGLLRFKPWQRDAHTVQSLKVGFLPVT